MSDTPTTPPDATKAYLDKAAKIHQLYEDRARSSDTPWYLYTDGSGQVDVPGAAAHVIYHRLNGTYSWGVSSFSSTTVERVELQALLDGLHAISGHALADGLMQVILNGDASRVQVVWVGDRENLIRSVLRDEQNMTLNRRRINLDLWMSLAYWEQFFEILPVQRPRNTVPAQGVADEICGVARISLRDLIASIAPGISATLSPPPTCQ